MGRAHAGVDDRLSAPPYNFEEIPTVHALDEFWHRKYVEDEEGRLVRVPAGASGEAHPASGGHGDPSAEPVVLAARRLGRASRCSPTGCCYSWWLVAAGAAVIVVGLIGLGARALGGGVRDG